MWLRVCYSHKYCRHMIPGVFKDELGLVKGVSANIHIKADMIPKFCKPRPIPYVFRGQVKKELDRLQQAGIIPIVPVVKSDGSICVCGDYKVTINIYPMLSEAR